MGINSKTQLLKRIQDIQNKKGPDKEKLEALAIVLSEVVESTFLLFDEKESNFSKEPAPATNQSAYEGMTTFGTESYYGLESMNGPLVADGVVTIYNTEFSGIPEKGILMKEGSDDVASETVFSAINSNTDGDILIQSKGNLSFRTGGSSGVERLRLDAGGTVIANSLKVSENNVTGGGIIIGDSGGIVDNNDNYCSINFENGVRVFSSDVAIQGDVTLNNNGTIICNKISIRSGTPSSPSNYIRFSDLDTYNGYIENRDSSGTSQAMIFKSGSFYWGTYNPDPTQANMELSSSGALTCRNDIIAFGNMTAISDAKLKGNIRPIESALSKVMQLEGVRYIRKDTVSQKEEIGVIAQQVKEVIPEVVVYDEVRDLHSVDYGRLTALLLEAVKEQQKTIEKLTAQLDLTK